jgi:hypothetical protein
MALRSADLKIDSLTAEKIEADSIQRQIVIGEFDKPAFPLLGGMETFDSAPVAATFAACRTELNRLVQGGPPSHFDRSKRRDLLSNGAKPGAKADLRGRQRQ